MVPIQSTRKQERPFRQCKHCKNKEQRKETHYVCPGCDHVALCLYPCYFEYHSR